MESAYERQRVSVQSLQGCATERLLRGRDVFRLVTLSRTTVWRRVREGTFPAPVSLGSTRIAWRESDIAAWMAAQRLTTDMAPLVRTATRVRTQLSQ